MKQCDLVPGRCQGKMRQRGEEESNPGAACQHDTEAGGNESHRWKEGKSKAK